MSPPARVTISAMRSPKKPATHTSTGSPSSMKLYSADSMPALPVPGTIKVNGFWVWKA